jgi:Tol biopolymer transport system component
MTMSSRTLLFALGALALAACESPTEPMPANLEAMAVGPVRPPLEPPMPLRQQRIAFTSNRLTNHKDFVSKDYNIYVMNPDGSGIVRLTKHLADDFEPALSPDGSKIAFMSTRDGNWDIYVMNARDGSGLARLTTSPAYDFRPTWSPDGSKIAFVSNRDGNYEIYVMKAAGEATGSQNLTNNAAKDLGPAWSPNGDKIAFESDRDADPEIYVMNAKDGSGVDRLTTSPNTDIDPAWSPDGLKIAFSSARNDDDFEIYVMDATYGDSLPIDRLTHNADDPDAVQDSGPTWSLNGSKIAFQRVHGGHPNVEIYAMNSAGDQYGIHRLTTYSGADTNPSWGWDPPPGS